MTNTRCVSEIKGGRVRVGYFETVPEKKFCESVNWIFGEGS